MHGTGAFSGGQEDQKRALPGEKAHHQAAASPGTPWYDAKGARIQPHGGQVFWEGGFCCWYGENREHTTGKDGLWSFGIRCCRSKDLIIPPDVENPESDLCPDSHLDRPRIAKSRKTGRCVCWIRISGISACCTVLTSDKLTGPCTAVREHCRPLGCKVGGL